jgi:flavin reductase (DIM6/NTAB) family NADH-FMN oxidoreductase RutF
MGNILVSKQDFRQAMSEFATGVTVITTVDDKNEPHFMTANSFTSVCLEPPVVLVCVAHGTHTYGYLERSGRFGVNFLRREQQELGAYFAKRPEDRQGGVEYTLAKGEQGIPVLENSMVFMGCEVIGSHVYGDHTVFLAEVQEIRRHNSGAPLLFFQSRWYDPAQD